MKKIFILLLSASLLSLFGCCTLEKCNEKYPIRITPGKDSIVFKTDTAYKPVKVETKIPYAKIRDSIRASMDTAWNSDTVISRFENMLGMAWIENGILKQEMSRRDTTYSQTIDSLNQVIFTQREQYKKDIAERVSVNPAKQSEHSTMWYVYRSLLLILGLVVLYILFTILSSLFKKK